MSPVTHHIEIDKPVVHAPRKVPAALCSKIQAELDRMKSHRLLRSSNHTRFVCVLTPKI
jgi:hypothetical protein